MAMTTTTAMNHPLPQFCVQNLTNEFCFLGCEPGPEGANGKVPFPAESPSSLYQDAS